MRPIPPRNAPAKEASPRPQVGATPPLSTVFGMQVVKAKATIAEVRSQSSTPSRQLKRRQSSPDLPRKGGQYPPTNPPALARRIGSDERTASPGTQTPPNADKGTGLRLSSPRTPSQLARAISTALARVQPTKGAKPSPDAKSPRGSKVKMAAKLPRADAQRKSSPGAFPRKARLQDCAEKPPTIATPGVGSPRPRLAELTSEQAVALERTLDELLLIGEKAGIDAGHPG